MPPIRPQAVSAFPSFRPNVLLTLLPYVPPRLQPIYTDSMARTDDRCRQRGLQLHNRIAGESTLALKPERRSYFRLKEEGGNANSTASASIQIQGGLPVGSSQNQTFTWGSNAQLVADVQAWLDNPLSNFGWLLKNFHEVDDPSTPAFNEGVQTFRAFYTKEAEAIGLGTGPRLLLEYTPVPVPAAVWLFGSGLAAMVGFARCTKSQLVVS